MQTADNKFTASLIGATGLIGSELLHYLLNDPAFGHVRVIARSQVPLKHDKLQIKVIDFGNESAYRAAISGTDVIFCAVGTTRRQVKGNLALYRNVDFDIPVNAARFGADEGVKQVLVVSSVGANRASKNFYLKIKGDMEEAVGRQRIPSIGIFRPSMLLGQRKEFRLAEFIGQPVMKLLRFIIPSKYKPIAASDVAKAMITSSKKSFPGVRVYHYSDMVQ